MDLPSTAQGHAVHESLICTSTWGWKHRGEDPGVGVDWRCRTGVGRQHPAGAPEPSPEDSQGFPREWGRHAGRRKEYYEPRKEIHKVSSCLGTWAGSNVLGIQRDEKFPDEINSLSLYA